jgi:hypothetical protein
MSCICALAEDQSVVFDIEANDHARIGSLLLEGFERVFQRLVPKGLQSLLPA